MAKLYVWSGRERRIVDTEHLKDEFRFDGSKTCAVVNFLIDHADNESIGPNVYVSEEGFSVKSGTECYYAGDPYNSWLGFALRIHRRRSLSKLGNPGRCGRDCRIADGGACSSVEGVSGDSDSESGVSCEAETASRSSCNCPIAASSLSRISDRLMSGRFVVIVRSMIWRVGNWLERLGCPPAGFYSQND